jgi:hypothetical protein
MSELKQRVKSSNVSKKADVSEALSRLRQFHAQGTKSLTKYPGRVLYGSMIALDEKGGSSEMLRKARQFAEVFALDELNDLCDLCERHSFAQGVGHVFRLLRIQKDRKGFFQTAIKHRWSVKQLDVEILRRNKSHSQAGRRRRVPADKLDACFQIYRFCDQWRRLTQSLQSPGRALQYRRDLGRDIRESLQKADKVLKQLGELTSAMVVLPPAAATGKPKTLKRLPPIKLKPLKPEEYF